MTTSIEYALMAGHAYRTTRDEINWFPIPQGWSPFFPVPDSTTLNFPATSGFEAISFQRGNEIVISFAGTNPSSMVDPDWIANIDLTTSLVCAQQLKEAAAYYLAVKEANKDNPDITISFTGHSLGGGLAALLGVFFDKKAVTFDQAPFANSAKESIRNELVTYLNGLYSPEELATLAPELFFFTNSDLAARTGNVSGYYVEGEVLSSSLVLKPFSTIGNQKPLIQGAPADNLAFQISLHSQTLLTAFLQNDAFLQVTDKLPDMVKMLFDERLFAHNPSKLVDPQRNYLEGLIQHQTGASGDNMLGRFTADLQLIAQEGGLSLNNNNITKALTAFAMQKYDNELETGAGAGTQLFSSGDGLTGGIRFDMLNVAAVLADAKGFTGTDLDKMFTSYLNSLTPSEATTALKEELPDLLDWYIQAGSQAMNATAGTQRAFMLGGSGDDFLTGGSQADVLVGNMGQDTLYGGAGDDVLLTGWKSDGFSDNTGDILNGGIGNDTLYGGYGADILNGGADTDLMIGGEGMDTYYIEGNDTIRDTGRNVIVYQGQVIAGAFLREGTSNTYSFLGDNKFTLTFNSPGHMVLNGTDSITFEQQTNAAAFENGDFGFLLAGDYDYSFMGSDSDDEAHIWLTSSGIWEYWFASSQTIEVDPANPVSVELSGGIGSDYLIGLPGHDRLMGGDGADYFLSNHLAYVSDLAGDLMEGGAGNDLFQGGTQDDVMYGGADNDYFTSHEGYDVLFGEEEEDVLAAGSDGDYLNGGSGNDLLMGDHKMSWAGKLEQGDANAVNVTFQFDVTWGWATGYTFVGFNLVQTSMPGNDILYGGDGNDILVGGGGNDILMGEADHDRLEGGDGDDYLDGGSGNDLLLGDDGDMAPSGKDTLYGGAGDDELYGFGGDDYLDGGNDQDYLAGGSGNDTLRGGIGNDILTGGDGNDTYIFGRGDGQDIVNDSSGVEDTIRFADALASEVRVTRDQANIYLAIGSTGDTLTLENWFLDNSYKIERLEFADGTTWDAAKLENSIMVAPSSDAGDILYASDNGEVINGLGGDDDLTGGNGNDTLYGGPGLDLLMGNAGDDTLVGGDGNDFYMLDHGFGHDTVIETVADGDVDRIIFAGDIAPSDVYVYHDERNLYFSVTGTNDLLTLSGWFTLGIFWGLDDWAQRSQFMAVEEVRFADGTIWNAGYLKAIAADVPYTNALTLYGTDGADFLRGYIGDDKLYGGAGDDILNGGTGDDELYGDAGNDHLYGEAGHDQLYDNSGSNVLDGGDGDDFLQGGSGDDTLYGGEGHDTLSDTSGNNILDGGGGDDYMSSGNGNDVLVGGEGHDQLYDNSGSNVLDGGDGDDFLQGGSGDDTLYGGAGSDTLSDTLGNNILDGGGGDDYILSGYGNDVLIGGDGNDNLTGLYGGNDVLTGGNGDDYLSGGDGNDSLIGSGGNDSLYGGAGDDVYVFGRGFGQDMVYEPNYSKWANSDLVNEDVIRFIDGITPADVFVYRGSQHGYHGEGEEIVEKFLCFDIKSTDDHLCIYGWFDNDYYKIEKVEFADGTLWDMAQIIGAVVPVIIEGDDQDNIYRASLVGDITSDWIYGYGGNDYLNGRAGDDILDGGYGDDTIYGEDGKDSLFGGSGDDYLEAGAGNDILNGGDGIDILDGGLGDDILDGGTGDDELWDESGNDVFVFGRGYGKDIIYTWDDELTFNDVIRFNSDVAPEDVIVAHTDDGTNSLMLSIKKTNDTLTVDGFFDPEYGPIWQIDAVEFSDGTVWNVDQLTAFASESGGGGIITGTAGADTLTGTAANDTLQGGAGNDLLVGGDGNDIYIFNPGDGVDQIVDSSGTDTILFGEGITPDSLSLGLGSLLVRVGDQGDAIHIEDFNPEAPFNSSVIEQFQFADGTVLGIGDLLARGFDIQGTNEADLLTGTSITDRITGRDGNDTLAGGKGDDLLAGGGGNDTYVFNLGDGQDTIADISSITEGNLIAFGAGITASDLAFARDGGDLLIQVGSQGDALRLKDFDRFGNNGSLVAGTLQFADGSQASLFALTNTAPVVGVMPQNQTALEDMAYSFVIPADTFTDADGGDSLTYSATLGNGNPLPAWLTFDPATQTFSGTPANDDVGMLDVTVTATDTAGASVVASFALDIANVNDAPMVAAQIPAQSATEDAVFSFTIPVETFTDVDAGDSLTYSATLADASALPSWLSFDAATRTLSGTPENGDVGILDITVTATDSTGASVAETFAMGVINTNDAPMTMADAGFVGEDQALLYSGNVLNNDSDVDAGTILSIAAPGEYIGKYGTLTIGADGGYTYSLDNASSAVQSLGRGAVVAEHFGYMATDGIANVDSALDITLTGSNDAPILVAPLADQQVKFNKNFSWQMPAGSFVDPDQGDTLAYSATLADGSALPSWLSFDAATQTFSGRAPRQVGSVAVKVTATDKVAATGSTEGSLATSDVFQITVSHENNGEDNCNDGPGAPGRHRGYNGHRSDDRDDDRSRVSDKARKDGNDHEAWRQPQREQPVYLNASHWNNDMQTPEKEKHGKQVDPSVVFGRWLTMDLAVSRALAEKKTLSWLDERLGADTTALGKASTGFLDSAPPFGSDLFSLQAGHGQELKGFKGLGEGLRKVA